MEISPQKRTIDAGAISDDPTPHKQLRRTEVVGSSPQMPARKLQEIAIPQVSRNQTKRSQYGTGNQASLKFNIGEMLTDNLPAESKVQKEFTTNVYDTILAFLNSGEGGIVRLIDSSNCGKGPQKYDWIITSISRKLRLVMPKGVGLPINFLEGPTDDCYLIFVQATLERFFKKTHAYQRDGNSTGPEIHGKELLANVIQSDMYRNALPDLPKCFNYKCYCKLGENDQIDLKCPSSDIFNIMNVNDNKVGKHSISKVKNMIQKCANGCILFGIEKDGNHGVPMPEIVQKDLKKTIADNINQSKMILKNWWLTFVPVKGSDMPDVQVIVLVVQCNDKKALPELPSVFEYGERSYFSDHKWEKVAIRRNHSILSFFTGDSIKKVSAFANTNGGHFLMGIHDNGQIVGYSDIINEERFCRALHDKFKKLYWYQTGKGWIEPECGCGTSDNLISIDFIPVEGDSIPRKLVAVSVKKLPQGIVFTALPEFRIINLKNKIQDETGTADNNRLQTYSRDMTNNEVSALLNDFAKTEVEEHQGAEPSDELDMLCDRFKKLQLHDPKIKVETIKGHHPSELREMLLPTKKGVYEIKSESYMVPSIQKRLEASCGADEMGVMVVTTNFKYTEAFTTQTKCDKIEADILLISDKKGVHYFCVYTGDFTQEVENYSTELAANLDKHLKGHSPKGQMEQFVLIRHIVNEKQPSADLFSSVRVPEALIPKNINSLLESLAVILNSFPAPISNISVQTGAQILNIWTADQSKLIWKTFHTHKRLFVHGLAGTGKTLIAVEVARRLIKKDGPASVLFLCVNASVRNRIRRALGPEAEVRCVSSFKSLYRKGRHFGNVQHVILDEAQNIRYTEVSCDDYGVKRHSDDFDWYDCARELIKANCKEWDPGYLWVFCDMSQKAHNVETGLPTLRKQAKHKIHILHEIVRNPVKVYEKALEMHNIMATSDNNWEGTRDMYNTDVIPKSKVSHGIPGVVEDNLQYRTLTEKYKVIEKLINKHKRQSTMAAYKDIAVLVNKKGEAEALQAHLRERCNIPVAFADDEEDAESGSCLMVDSVLRFGGMDKPVIILVDLKTPRYWFNSSGYTYQAYTRAVNTLYVVTWKP